MIDGVLMWFFDADKHTTLAQKLSSAAATYRVKKGKQPTIAYLHPATAGGVTEASGMTIKPDATVQRSHFYLGEQN